MNAREGSAASSASPGSTADATPNPVTTPARAPVITLENLGVEFDQPVLKGLNAELSGNCIGLLGPNGAGKTTLINTLLGFHKPQTGSAQVLGLDVSREGAELRRVVGYMPERDAFIAGMSGVRFVRLMAELSGLPPAQALERAHEMFFYVGLGDARYRMLETYSLGMKQMVKLAQAIVHGPRLLILDEPTNGLDPPARARMLALIREIRDSGDTHIVMSSHLLRDVEACCDEVIVLKAGEVATVCDLAAERSSNRKFLLLQTAGDDSGFAGALRDLGCEVAEQSRRQLRAVLPASVEVSDLYQTAARLGTQIRRMDYKRDSLEDIFLRAMAD